MIVPGAHKRPAGPRILQVGVGKVALPNRAVAFERRRNVENGHLQRVRDPRNLIDFPVEAGLAVLRILNDLVDEIAEMKDEVELVLGPRPFILEDHPAITVELALIGA